MLIISTFVTSKIRYTRHENLSLLDLYLKIKNKVLRYVQKFILELNTAESKLSEE